MKILQLGAWSLIGLLGAGLVLADPANAKPGRGNGNGNRPTPAATVEDVDVDVDVDDLAADLLTGDRVDTLLDILLGTDDDYADLISEELRLEILDDIDTLPPGIQRQLARGRGLPPGIAKKHRIPASVLPLLDLEPDTELLIIGDNIVIVDPAEVILDMVEGIF